MTIQQMSPARRSFIALFAFFSFVFGIVAFVLGGTIGQERGNEIATLLGAACVSAWAALIAAWPAWKP